MSTPLIIGSNTLPDLNIPCHHLVVVGGVQSAKHQQERPEDPRTSKVPARLDVIGM